MEKKAFFGIVLIIAAILILLYINAEIVKAEKLALQSHIGGYAYAREVSSSNNWKDIPVLKTVRFVGFVIGATGFLLLLAGLFSQPRNLKKIGAIYADRPANKPLDE